MPPISAMPARKTTRRSHSPAAEVASNADPDAPLPQYSLSVVVAAFAAGMLLGTHTGRALTRRAIRAGLSVLKPALVVGGMFKLNDFAASRPHLDTPPPTP